MPRENFRPGAPGVVFRPDTGKLYQFSAREVVVMAPWPEPRAWIKTWSEPGWRHFRPAYPIVGSAPPPRFSTDRQEAADGQYLLPFVIPDRVPGVRGADAWGAYCSLIPEGVRPLVAGHSERHFHLLSFLARCGSAAQDLAATNPALAGMLASSWAFHRPRVSWPLRSVRALLKPGKKQRDALAWLGFPPDDSARRITAKVDSAAVTVGQMLYLRGALQDAVRRKRLGHLPRLNAGALCLATHPNLIESATPKLLQEVASLPEERVRPRAAYRLRDTLSMLQQLGREPRELPRIHSVRALNTLHDELVREFNLAELRSVLSLRFPPPPVPGTPTIVPLETPEMLLAEGRDQAHCAGSYAPRVAEQRGVYLYKVLEPERATLSIQRDANGWAVAELLGRENRPVSATTRTAVEAWLATAGTSERRPWSPRSP